MKTIILIIYLGIPELGPTGFIELSGFDSLEHCEEIAQTYTTDLDEMFTNCEVR